MRKKSTAAKAEQVTEIETIKDVDVNLVPTDPQHSMTRERIDLIKRMFCKGATDDELSLFIEVCRRTGLSPEARQIYAVKRYDSSTNRETMSFQTSIDGFRLTAERTGKYAGQLGPFWCGSDGKWVDVWVSKDFPIAAKVGALRHDFKEPAWAVARWDSYVQTKRDGSVTKFWAKMSDLMLAKCAEALALRKAFPQELSGLYTSDEMAQAQNTVEVEYEPTKEASRPEVSISEKAMKVINSFDALGVSRGQLEAYAGKCFSKMTDEDFNSLRPLYDDIRTGHLKSEHVGKNSPPKEADPTVEMLRKKFGS